MGDHDDDAAAVTDAQERARQSFFALAVEIRVRLVKNDKEWIAVERTGERDALPLAG